MHKQPGRPAERASDKLLIVRIKGTSTGAISARVSKAHDSSVETATGAVLTCPMHMRGTANTHQRDRESTHLLTASFCGKTEFSHIGSPT